MKPFRLTRQAEDHLTDIAIWTHDTFGPRQAEAYEEDLIRQCEQIASGAASHQSCSVLVEGIDCDLRFARVGQHFVVFLDNDDAVVIVDFLHSRSNLPAKIGYLESKFS